MVLVAAVRLNRRNHGPRADEARDIVNVTVRVVAFNTAAEPNDVVHTQILREDLFEIFFAEPAIALLLARKQTFFGGEHRPAAIDVYAAAFEDYAMNLLPFNDRGNELLHLQ